MREQVMIGGLLLILAALGGSAAPSRARPVVEPFRVVSELTELGPRPAGGPTQSGVRETLVTAMRTAGLVGVTVEPVAGPPDLAVVAGTLPGEPRPRIALTAHYDTVAGSPGALDNASGCGVVIGAAAELARTRRHHAIRVMLVDGEESLAAGSRAWLAGLSESARRDILASVSVDMVGARGSQEGFLHLLAAREDGRRVVTPAWMVRAVLRSAESAGLRLVVQDRRWSWFSQLGARCARSRRVSDGHRFLEHGIPALTLSDFPASTPGPHYHSGSDRVQEVDADRLRLWAQVLVAVVQRLDGFAGRPRPDTEYLVVGGRVWTRRELVWGGFGLWVLLVWRGLPGRWRGESPAERRRLGRAYVPGFTFRMLFLASVFIVPTFAAVLLFPAAAAALLPRALDKRFPGLLCLLGGLPALAFVVWLVVAQLAGWLALDRSAVLPGALVLLTVLAFCSWLTEAPGRSR